MKIMMNVGNPQLAFDFAQLPNHGGRPGAAGVHHQQQHRRASEGDPRLPERRCRPEEGGRKSVARGHASPRAFYVDKVAEGIATIAAAFWPKPVIVRLSDFKSNEYKQADRRLAATSRKKKTRCSASAARLALPERGLSTRPSRWNARRSSGVRRRHGPDQRRRSWCPSCARSAQAEKRRPVMLAVHGLKRASAGGTDNLKLIMMCEVPSNAILAGGIPRPVLRRLLDRLERPDPTHPRPGPRFRPRTAGGRTSTSATRRSRP